jgi:hypothetical protein
MSGTLIGYARCSTDDQDLTAQRDRLRDLGVAERRIYLDHGLTGTNRAAPVGFKNCATGHDQVFHRGGQATAWYSLIRPPSMGVRLIRCAGNGMTSGWPAPRTP